MRRCTVCVNPDRDAINQALLSGTPVSRISALFRVSPDSLQRHKTRHIPAALKKAQEIEQVTEANKLLATVQTLNAEARRIAEKAEAANNLRTALAGIRQQVQIQELLARLLGELRKDRSVIIDLPAVATAGDLPGAMASVVKGVTEGRITPAEGQALAGILEGQRRVLESAELEVRIRDLEEKTGGQA